MLRCPTQVTENVWQMMLRSHFKQTQATLFYVDCKSNAYFSCWNGTDQKQMNTQVLVLHPTSTLTGWVGWQNCIWLPKPLIWKLPNHNEKQASDQVARQCHTAGIWYLMKRCVDRHVGRQQNYAQRKCEVARKLNKMGCFCSLPNQFQPHTILIIEK